MPMTKAYYQSAYETEYSCDVCDRTFNSKKLIELHEKVNHGGITHRKPPTNYCTYCDMEFDNTKAVLRHMKRCHKV